MVKNSSGLNKQSDQKKGVETEQQKREFWDDLLALMEDGNVVPVIGAELFTIPVGNDLIPLYRMVAEKLLERYNLKVGNSESLNNDNSVILRSGSEINDAVWAISKRKNKRFQDLYNPVHIVLESVIEEYQEALLEPLKKFLSIPALTLFITTTCDNLLARAINLVRYEEQNETIEIEFAPKLPGDKKHDLPTPMRSDQAAVFYIFGKASASPIYAIHEEDMLEFIYLLQQGRGSHPEGVLRRIISSNLLFIGCPLSDWLGRLLVRSSNEKRLRDDRDKREFMVVNKNSTDQHLTTFLERYSHDTRIYFSDARSFVDELTGYWFEEHPTVPVGDDKVSEVSKGLRGNIFISYASQDYEVALNVFKEFESLAGAKDIAFIDKKNLECGDDWEVKIMHAIKNCKLFVPLISINTEKRADTKPVPVFIREWVTAAEESKFVISGKFIYPLIIDNETRSIAVNELKIPEGFKKLHFGHAIDGYINDEMRNALKKEIRKMRPGSK